MLPDQPPAGVPAGRRRRAVQVQQADVGHGGEQLPGQLARGDVRRGPDQALLAPGGEQLAELDQGLFDGVQELGAGGPRISVVGYGAWEAGGGYYGENPPDEEMIAAMRAGFDAGVDWVDTAPGYGLGHSEEVVGRALAGREG